jgi:hypothetical protein
MEQAAATPEQSGNKKKKVILIGIGALAAGTLGYFGYGWWKKHKAEKEDTNYLPPPPSKEHFKKNSPSTGSGENTNTSSGSDTTAANDFPLKKGSRGPKVKTLQKALIGKYGKSIMPRYGADGDFGSETVAALKKAGLPAEIDESTYNVIIQGVAASSSIEASATAKQLYDAAIAGSIADAVTSLKQMQSIEDYKSVNKEFQNYRIGGVRETLVNGLLTSFQDESQRQKIRMEFLRMGLKYDGSKWSLSGIPGTMIMTTAAAFVWENPKKAIKVPKNMVLGIEVEERSGYTLFESSGRHFLIESKFIKNV